MGKKNDKKNDAKATKKGPDITGQKVKKARRALQSGGKRGLVAFLAAHDEIRGHKVVAGLIQQADNLPVRKPKGKRGPIQPQERVSEV